MLEYVTIDHGFEIRHAHEVMRVEQWGRDSVRVRCAQHAIAPTDAGALEAAPEPRDCSPAVRDGEEVRLVVDDSTALDAHVEVVAAGVLDRRARTLGRGRR